MTGILLSVYNYFSRHKYILYVLLLFLTLLFSFSAYHINFKEDISQFLSSDTENKRINDAYKYISSSNTIIVYCGATTSSVETADKFQMQTDAIDLLAERLQTGFDSTCIKNLRYTVDPTEMLNITSFIAENMPYFIDNDDYKRLDTLISHQSIKNCLEADKNMLTSSVGMILRQNILSDPLRISASLLEKLQNFRLGDGFFLYQDHIFSKDSLALLFIDCNIPSSETAKNEVFIDSLKLLIQETNHEFKDIVTLNSFGASEIAVTNARQIKKDTLFSCILAIIIVMALLLYSFRNLRQIFLTLISALFGGLFALACLGVLKGEVSVIAVGISSIMFGIAINYPLHFIQHFNHVKDIKQTIKDLIEPLITGNITTVAAFISLIFIGSSAMLDLGLFAALLLVGTIIFVLIFLPHFLKEPREISGKSFIDKLLQSNFEKNKKVTLLIVVLTVIFAFFNGGSLFESNMQKINYMTESQQESFGKMMNILNDNNHVIYYVSEGNTLDKALESNEKSMAEVINNKEITKTAGIGAFLPSQERQAQKVKQWNDFWESRSDSVSAFINAESERLGFKAGAFGSFDEMIHSTCQVVDISHFEPVMETLAKNYIAGYDNKYMVINMLYTEPSNAEKLEAQLNESSKSSFAFDSGTITRRMIDSLSDNFNYVLYVCGFVVFVFLLFSFGRIELALIAFIPLALSWIWITGIMNIFDIKFNIVNIILATFIFGQGDDYTIFMTEGLMYEYKYKKKTLASYKKSILLSALIMLTGMGMLLFAKHPALRSLGEVTVIGMVTVVIMAFVIPSLIFRLLTMKKGRKRTMPVTFKNLSFMIFSFVMFLVLSFLITVSGWIIISFGGNKNKSKLRFHRILYRISNFCIAHILQVKTVFRNILGEKFEKPAVIICNHQSHLDLLCVMMLTPKLIILTNDWVWKSPFYGKLVKHADYYPVSNGIEKALDKLKKAVEQGYSIAVFPEGTRSGDCSIKRFHRGAFYLAEQFHLDIIPVLIHGAGHALPKDDFMLRKGQIDIRIFPRITPDDERFGKDYSRRSKEIRHFYQEEYAKLCLETETPDYYVDSVVHNYIYKGASIERAVRKNLRKNKNFNDKISALPDSGEITVENSGYGEYPLMLSLVKKDLKITAIEKDDDIREIAGNCPSVSMNLRYVGE